MALIQWNDGLSVGVAEFDRQHQRLIAMINDLNDAMRAGQGKEVLERIVGGLANYAVEHFKTEEKYFDRFAYPEAASHKQKHAEFAARVSEFKEGLKDGHIGLSVEVMTFLSDWLRGHIKGVDKAYGPFFNEKGLK